MTPRKPPPMSLREFRRRYTYNPETGRLHNSAGKELGTTHSLGYRRISFVGTTHYEHRLIYWHQTGRWMKELDHINGDRSDNRIENLRPAEHWQNGPNVFDAKGYSKFRNGYKATIQHKGKHRHLGCFRTAEEARAAYVQEHRRLLGAYAKH